MEGVLFVVKLSNQQAAQYEEDGYICPLPAVGVSEADNARRELLAFGEENRINLSRDFRGKSFMRLKCLSDIAHSPNVLDAVEGLIGPNILCFYGSLFIKAPYDNAGTVPWHQDGGYFSKSSEGFATAWIALSESTVENGAMRVLPGTHKERRPHGTVDDAEETLFYDINVRMLEAVNEADAVHLVLKSGEMSFHHPDIAHASAPNNTDSWRVGMALRYVSPDFYMPEPEKVRAVLMRGANHGENYEIISAPRFDEDPEILEAIRRDEEMERKSDVAHVDL